MLNRLFILCMFLVTASTTQAATMVIAGNYYNQNIYVLNPISGTGVGFCTYEISVNGNVSIDEIYSDAFEIDLAYHELKEGQPVVVKIKYKDDGCIPKVLNPSALLPNPTFETYDINVDEKGTLTWTTGNEKTKLPYVVEQFKWNKWVKIGEVMGEGAPGTHKYKFQTEPIAGLNKFRVKQKGYIDKTRYTPSVNFNSHLPEVLYIYDKKTDYIEFSRPTSYEVYDKWGNVIKKGFGAKFNIGNLDKQTYYMNYGNTISEIRRK